MDTPRSSRRQFCAHAISLIPVASLAKGCGGSKGSPTGPTGGSNPQALSTINAGVTGGTIVLPIDAASPLASVGSAALVQASSGSFLVARTGQASFSALSAICTHEACVVTGFSSGTFVCPCHGSQYNTSGAVQTGPATRPLPRFATQFTDNVLTITL